MNSFTFSAPPTLRFGWGEVSALPVEAARLGRRPLVVAGRALRAAGRLEPVLAGLREAGLAPALSEPVPPEPTLADLQRMMDACVAADADSVIAIGGGSVLDIAKGAAVLAGVGPSATEFFAGAPGGRPVDLPAAGRPILAVPTTSGTGSFCDARLRPVGPRAPPQGQHPYRRDAASRGDRRSGVDARGPAPGAETVERLHGLEDAPPPPVRRR